MIEPITAIAWIFVAVFFFTAVITVGGILENIKFIKVQEKYLKGLYYALLIEVIAASITLATTRISDNTDVCSECNKTVELLRKEITKIKSNRISSTLDLFSYQAGCTGRNMNIGEKEAILNIKLTKDGNFRNLSYEELLLLVKRGHACPFDQYNSSPTILEFLAFMEKYPLVKAYGFSFNDKNSPAILIEGLTVQEEDVTDALKIVFYEFNKEADELDSNNGLRSWWD